jgi:hypothetical protein
LVVGRGFERAVDERGVGVDGALAPRGAFALVERAPAVPEAAVRSRESAAVVPHECLPECDGVRRGRAASE